MSWNPNRGETLEALPGSNRGKSESAPLLCLEGFYLAGHPVALAVGFHRVDIIIVGCPRLEAFYTHAENRIGMAGVQPDWRFRCLAKILGIRTVLHPSVIVGRSPRVVGCPPHNCQLGVGTFHFWNLRVLAARCF